MAAAVFVNLLPDHVILHRMLPLAGDRTVVGCDWLYASEAVASRACRDGGVPGPAEHHIGVLHDWLLGRLGSARLAADLGR